MDFSPGIAVDPICSYGRTRIKQIACRPCVLTSKTSSMLFQAISAAVDVARVPNPPTASNLG